MLVPYSPHKRSDAREASEQLVYGMVGTVRNALTVDVEDWAQAYLDYDLPLTRNVVSQTSRVLEVLDQHNVKGTFFVLGQVASIFPGLVGEIRNAGHEVGVHGWRHVPIWDLAPGQFKTELTQAKQAVEDASGSEVRGFRAPRFSVVRNTWWALSVIEECGFEYDSSVFPAVFPGRGYGVRGAFPYPSAVTSGLFEFPLTTLALFGWRLPVGGGGYLRFLPMFAHKRAIRALNREGRPGVVYLHPHELDPTLIQRTTHNVPLTTRISQGFRRSQHEQLASTLLSEFSFGPMGEVLDHWMRQRRSSASSIDTP